VSEVGGEDIGEMVGINTDSLQLSHVSIFNMVHLLSAEQS